MSITTAIRAWFTTEVVDRVTAVETRIEAAVSDITAKEEKVRLTLTEFLAEAKTEVPSFDGFKSAVIAEVLTILKADGVQITEALLEKYGVSAAVAGPIAESVVQTAESAVEAAE